MKLDACKKCGQELRTGDLVAGWDFSDKGQEHINCPKPEKAESAKAGQ